MKNFYTFHDVIVLFSLTEDTDEIWTLKFQDTLYMEKEHEETCLTIKGPYLLWNF